tara:strand:- start:1060 stop:1257 length:198 start_codon:yes stop_codon:yes gene_type:complete
MTYSQEPAGQPGWSGNKLIDRLAKPLAKALARGDLVGHSGLPQPGRFVLDNVKNVVALDGIIGFG